MRAIEKELSLNDVGETGGHQAGILIPKTTSVLSFFPELEVTRKNPRTTLVFEDDFGNSWKFEFIYYNNKWFGGTRNEYRLTHMTKFIRSANLKAGDVILLTKDEFDTRRIRYRRKNQKTSESAGPRLKLGSSWKVIKF